MANEPEIEDSSGKTEPRHRRDRVNIRELLLESAISEFAQKGFEGASTTSIAKRADAHQPQINYHFSSKAELWRAVVDRLFVEFSQAAELGTRGEDPTERFSSIVRSLVVYSSARPELAQIFMHESAAATERLDWIVETYSRGFFDYLHAQWTALTAIGVAAEIDADLVYYVIMGASTLPFMNRAEARRLIKTPTDSSEFVNAYVEGLLGMLLPGRPPSDG